MERQSPGSTWTKTDITRAWTVVLAVWTPVQLVLWITLVNVGILASPPSRRRVEGGERERVREREREKERDRGREIRREREKERARERERE